MIVRKEDKAYNPNPTATAKQRNRARGRSVAVHLVRSAVAPV
jgi:hypothetical protein